MSLLEKFAKIGARIVTNAGCVTFQMAKIAMPSQLFAEVLRLTDGLRLRPARARVPASFNASSRGEECVRMTRKQPKSHSGVRFPRARTLAESSTASGALTGLRKV